MTQSNFISSAEWTRTAEGGLSLVASDSGNYLNGALVGSKYGITPPVLADWLGGAQFVTSSVMRDLSIETFQAIASARYWRAVDAPALPAGIDHMLFDFGFNSGVARSAKLLQTLVGLKADEIDGDIGPITIDALTCVLVSTKMPGWSYSFTHAQALQRDLGVFVDGNVGVRTWDAVIDHKAQARALIYAVASAQERAYRSFTAEFRVSGKGWLNRLAARLAFALLLNDGKGAAAVPNSTPTPTPAGAPAV